MFTCSVFIMDGLYIITPYEYAINNSILEPSCSFLLLKRKVPFDFEDYLVCESCLEDKMTNRPFSAKGYRAKDLTDFVHTNVCSPMSV